MNKENAINPTDKVIDSITTRLESTNFTHDEVIQEIATKCRNGESKKDIWLTIVEQIATLRNVDEQKKDETSPNPTDI